MLGLRSSQRLLAAAGLDVLDREHIDVVITDMNMPGTGGAQFIPEARARWPQMPIVAISGAAIIDGRNTADIARALGADATLIKPFRARELAALIERVLDIRRAPGDAGPREPRTFAQGFFGAFALGGTPSIERRMTNLIL